MAPRKKVVLTDDIDGSVAEKTIRFGFNGTEYEIDLSQQHADQLAAVVEPYVVAARRIAGPRRPGAWPAVQRQRQASVREWARPQGLKVSDRGRIPVQVIAQYQTAH